MLGNVGKRGSALLSVVGVAILLSACSLPARRPAPAVRTPPPTAPASTPSTDPPGTDPEATTCVATSTPPDAVTADVLDGMNADRVLEGLPALQWDGQLYCLALEWSEHMASTVTFTHQDLVGALASLGGYSTLAENILRGPGSISGDAMVGAWMGSAAHRANILSTSLTAVGIAPAFAADGTVYVTADFGA